MNEPNLKEYINDELINAIITDIAALIILKELACNPNNLTENTIKTTVTKCYKFGKAFTKHRKDTHKL